MAWLSSSEIASQLIMAVTTARTHLRNIHGKLGVHSRQEAIERAEETGLI